MISGAPAFAEKGLHRLLGDLFQTHRLPVRRVVLVDQQGADASMKSPFSKHCSTIPSSMRKQSASSSDLPRCSWRSVTHSIVGERVRMSLAVCCAQSAYSGRDSPSSDFNISGTVACAK